MGKIRKWGKCDYCGKEDFIPAFNLCQKHYWRQKLGKPMDFCHKTDPNKIIVRGDIAYIYLRHLDGKIHTKIDKRDLSKVISRKWSFQHGYAFCRKERLMLHSVILGGCSTKKSKIDHINRDPLDNRRANLRLVSNSENGFNGKLRKNNTSGHTGIFRWKEKKKWIAYIRKDYKRKTLGSFIFLRDAIRARKEAEKLYFPNVIVS